MTKARFLTTLTKIAASPTKYDRGSAWADWIAGRWHFDCVRLVKAVVWEFSFAKDKPHGGCVPYPACTKIYPDYTTEQMIATCENVRDLKISSSVSCNAEPGELLWMRGHVGVYLGNGNVIEAAPSLGGVAVTNIKYQRWEKVGQLPCIEYDAAPTPAPAPKPVLKAGEALQLTNEPLYASSTREKPSNHVTGTYYLTDGKLIKGRVRICSNIKDVGQIAKVTGWIDWRW